MKMHVYISYITWILFAKIGLESLDSSHNVKNSSGYFLKSYRKPAFNFFPAGLLMVCN